MAADDLIFSYKGRDLLFFDELKKNLEDLVCPICQEISSDPVQTSCCGHLFCKQCLKGPTCPLCRQRYTSVSDQFNTRKIKGLKVGCSNEGCDWKGELGEIVGHFETCMYENIPCANKCGENNTRIGIFIHMFDNCPFRMVKCEYCQWEDKANTLPEHTTFCPALPVPCPDGCGQSVPREMLEKHSETCPKRLVKCKYFAIGCRVLLPADKMADHLVQAEGDHLKKAMDKVVELSVAMGSVYQQLHSPCGPQNSFVPRLWLENKSGSRACPWIIEMSNFFEIHGKVWFSPPFYTHPGGYKLCMEVYGNGHGASQGVHLSLFIRLMKGECDECLKWPLSLKIIIMLLNQIDDSDHVSHTVDYNDASEKVNSRVIKGNMARSGRGRGNFLPLTDLAEDQTKKVQYLKNDCLFFKVDRVSA